MKTTETPTKYEPEFLNRWKHPGPYFGAEWTRHFVFLGKHRDSDSLSRANFDAGMAALEKLPAYESKDSEDEKSSRFAVHESHWAVGWVEWIAIHEGDADALRVADRIAKELENYPVVDDELFSEYEEQEANETWKNCYDWEGRVRYVRKFRDQFNFVSFTDLLGCIRGNYFGGYASELLA